MRRQKTATCARVNLPIDIYCYLNDELLRGEDCKLSKVSPSVEVAQWRNMRLLGNSGPENVIHRATQQN